MTNEIYSSPTIIKETDLDSFGHLNNAVYLKLFEQARWDVVTNNGYGFKKVQETGIAPVILEIKLSFLKELRVRDEINIETQLIFFEKSKGKIAQKMLRNGEVCCKAEFVIAFFDLKERRLIPPSKDWLEAMGAVDLCN